MKFFLINLIFWETFIIVIKSSISSEEQLRPEDYNITWMHFSNGSDLPEIIYLTEPPKPKSLFRDVDIQFELYTNNNTNIPMVIPSFTFIKKRPKRDLVRDVTQNFDKNLDTKIIVHGWKSSSSSDTIQAIKNAYLVRGSYNIIAVNWQNLSSDIYYLRPAGRTQDVGQAIAKLINYMVEILKQNPNQIHLIGHSLGAHIMGYAGSYAKYRVSRITGLDPARPAFEGITGPEQHLDLTDADFVDVIHSCAGLLGFQEQLGHVDFYPNGGYAPQPGCGSFFDFYLTCSHGRAHVYFAESINSEKGFYAYPCKTWKSFENNECLNDSILMGDKVPISSRGKYFLRTNNKPSFAIGI